MKKLIAAITLIGLLTMGAFAQGAEKKPAAKPTPAAKKAAPVKKDEAPAATGGDATTAKGKAKTKGKKKTTATPTPTPTSAPKK